MDKRVSNATPLIYLAKADRLSLLKAVSQEILVPQAVFSEVVVEGKRLGENDAYRVDQCIKKGWMVVRDVDVTYVPGIPLHPGEAEVISLAIEMNVKEVLMDDAKGRLACQLAGLKPIGTLGILLRALQIRQLNFDEFLNTLQAIVRSGFYLKEEVYLKVIEVAKGIIP